MVNYHTFDLNVAVLNQWLPNPTGHGMMLPFENKEEVRKMTNTLMVIEPYWYSGTWVFDDESVGLNMEPFIENIPEMINDLVKDIPDARRGFRLLFSALPFPGYQVELEWVRPDYDGNWYRIKGQTLEGWLCPSMYNYFDVAPKSIFVKAEKL